MKLYVQISGAVAFLAAAVAGCSAAESQDAGVQAALPAPGELEVISVEPIARAPRNNLFPNGDLSGYYAGAPMFTGFRVPADKNIVAQIHTDDSYEPARHIRQFWKQTPPKTSLMEGYEQSAQAPLLQQAAADAPQGEYVACVDPEAFTAAWDPKAFETPVSPPISLENATMLDVGVFYKAPKLDAEIFRIALRYTQADGAIVGGVASSLTALKTPSAKWERASVKLAPGDWPEEAAKASLYLGWFGSEEGAEPDICLDGLVIKTGEVQDIAGTIDPADTLRSEVNGLKPGAKYTLRARAVSTKGGAAAVSVWDAAGESPTLLAPSVLTVDPTVEGEQQLVGRFTAGAGGSVIIGAHASDATRGSITGSRPSVQWLGFELLPE